MAVLVFLDDKHEYYIGEDRYPSVSEILRFMSKEIYSTVSQYTLDHAADRGRRVHKACENLDRYGEVEIDKDIEPYVRAYMQFLKDYTPQWLRIEYGCYDPSRRFAGTLDRYGIINGLRAVVDIKTTARVEKPYVTAQLNGYDILAEANGLVVEANYCLHLGSDGKYKLLEMHKDKPNDPDNSAFEACYKLHKIFEKKGRKK